MSVCIFLLCRKPGRISASAKAHTWPTLKEAACVLHHKHDKNAFTFLCPSWVYPCRKYTHEKEIWKNGNKMLIGRTGVCMVRTLLGPHDCFFNLLNFFPPKLLLFQHKNSVWALLMTLSNFGSACTSNSSPEEFRSFAEMTKRHSWSRIQVSTNGGGSVIQCEWQVWEPCTLSELCCHSDLLCCFWENCCLSIGTSATVLISPVWLNQLLDVVFFKKAEHVLRGFLLLCQKLRLFTS